MPRGEQVDQAAGVDGRRGHDESLSGQGVAPSSDWSKSSRQRLLLARGIHFAAGQGRCRDLAGRDDVAPQVVGEVAVADFAPLVGLDGEVLVPLGERVVVDRQRLQAQQLRRLARRELRLLQDCQLPFGISPNCSSRSAIASTETK